LLHFLTCMAAVAATHHPSHLLRGGGEKLSSVTTTPSRKDDTGSNTNSIIQRRLSFDWLFFGPFVYTCEVDNVTEVIEDLSTLSGPWKECMTPSILTGEECKAIIEQEEFIETVIIADPDYAADRQYKPCRVLIFVNSTGFVEYTPSRG